MGTTNKLTRWGEYHQVFLDNGFYNRFNYGNTRTDFENTLGEYRYIGDELQFFLDVVILDYEYPYKGKIEISHDLDTKEGLFMTYEVYFGPNGNEVTSLDLVLKTILKMEALLNKELYE